jgi:heptosyltransferase II
LRLLVVMPSWVGDAVMATPALRMLRSRLPGSYIGGLVRPGIDEIMAGTDLLDQVHVERARGVMGPKLVAGKVRGVRYEAALLLTNSFSSALISRLAFIPRRVGYDRDGRGVLLTQRLAAPRRIGGGWAPVPAVSYYWAAAEALLDPGAYRIPDASLPPGARLELGTTEAQEHEGEDVLAAARVPEDAELAILNPGGNRDPKRWPSERFAQVGAWLAAERGMTVLVNGSPAEAELVARIAGQIRESVGDERVVELPGVGVTLGSLKAVVRRCRVMVTNDTGPRHIAAAFGVPVVSLFGPTDPRWTAIPAPGGEAVLVADPTLPVTEVADDHPERCRVDRIPVERVLGAVQELLERGLDGGGARGEAGDRSGGEAGGE